MSQQPPNQCPTFLIVSHGMFLLPWSTGAASEKVLPTSPKVRPPKPLTATMSHVPLFNKQKRKREGSSSSSFGCLSTNAKSPKRRNVPTTQSLIAPYESVYSPTPLVREPSPVHADDVGRSTSGTRELVEKREMEHNHKARFPYDVMNLTPVQETIEAHFSLEILLKHRELRFIDQELAKCQVALEQLRRCQVMPYPASSLDPSVMPTVSSGTGPAYGTQAQSPAPWGVTDGPYARHYAKWLIPDPTFGDNVPEDRQPQLAGKALADRATRGSKSSKAQPGGSTRAQRGSAREKLQALPHGYPEPKEDKGPMIVKRSTDGQMVKLVCLDCRRDNFNSAQGFINHCRIAHSRGFASHDAAAIACGEEVDADATGGAHGVTSGSSNPTAGLVHPLIRSAHLTNSTPQISPATQQRRKKQQSKATVSSGLFGNLDGNSDMPSTPQAAPSNQLNLQAPFPFKPSPQTPHLSALFAKSGRGGDLDEMVNEATIKPDPEALMSDGTEDDDEDIEESIEQPVPQRSQGTLGVLRGRGRLPARSGMSPAPLERTPSSKGAPKPTQRRPDHLNTFPPQFSHATHYDQTSLPEPSYVSQSTTHESQPVTSAPVTSPTLNLSPNTIESYPAPSLVSDDGDYENTHSESETPSSAAVSEDEATFEVEVNDMENHHNMDLDHPGSSSATAEYGLSKAHHHHASQPARRRPSAMRDPGLAGSGLGQRRVSFQSPVPRGKGAQRRKGSK